VPKRNPQGPLVAYEQLAGTDNADPRRSVLVGGDQQEGGLVLVGERFVVQGVDEFVRVRSGGGQRRRGGTVGIAGMDGMSLGSSLNSAG
jgi:hypothetical protein